MDNAPVQGSVSVMIPTYRHARYIAQTLESVLNQSRPPAEVIVINDGSPDDTRSAVEPYLDRITYVEQENQGLVATLNRGLSLCSSDYVWMLASDDWLAPDAIAILAPILDAHADVGLVSGRVTFVDQDGVVDPTWHWRVPLGPQRDVAQLMKQNYIPAASTLCRRTALSDACPFRDFLYSQDWDMWLEIAHQGWHLYGVDLHVSFYRRHSGNLTHSENALPAVVDEIHMLEAFARRHPSSLSTAEREALSFTLRGRQRRKAWLALGGGDRGTAFSSFRRVARGGIDANVMMGLIATILPRSVYETFKRS